MSADAVARYAKAVAALVGAPSTREETYYPAIKTLIEELLGEQRLPFVVRTGTSEQRPAGGGVDLPDLALYDGSAEFPVVCGEIKLPERDLTEMACSTDGGDQIGRYLERSRVVLLGNVRGFALLTVHPEHHGPGPVPPAARRLEQAVELWPSASALRQGRAPLDGSRDALLELVETAVTRHASIAEPESLARILARQARRAKAGLPSRFSEAVSDLLDDFGKTLGVHFRATAEGEEFFRSSLIQTAFYGLFAGWTLWRQSGSGQPFRWDDLAEYLRIPFLGELFHEFRHPRRIKELGLARHLDAATETLNRVVPEEFFARFHLPSLADDGAAEISAITYFYEPFLEAFDPALRKELGVWYTPHEIVRYQVRNVDRLLREELHCERGFADERVIVLDPCCGTGAYLIEVLRCIAEQLREEGEDALVGARLLEAACERVLGFELLTAPFVIAQLQAYLALSRLGATPGEGRRPAIYLTNALTGWSGPAQLKLHFPEMQQEHDAARHVKHEQPIIVVLGNPPYNRFAGLPPDDEEQALADRYKGIERDAKGRQKGQSRLYERWGVRKHLLDDLYVRFFRLAEERIGERARHGIVSFISNSSYLSGRSHPLMRESLCTSFQRVWIDNLNGDKYKTGKVIPAGWPGAGSSDQSAFTRIEDARGIQVGTAVTTLLKLGAPPRRGPARVFLRDFWGRAEAKRRALLESLGMQRWPRRRRAEAAARPEGPRPYEELRVGDANTWRFAPSAAGAAFEDWPSLDELFPAAFQGVNPNRGLDGSVVDVDRRALEQRMRDYFSRLPFAELERRHPALVQARARYEPQALLARLRATTTFSADKVRRYAVFPLDARWLYYETEAKLLNERRPELWENLADNEFLVAVPQPRRVSETRPLVATCLFDLHLHDRGSVGFPATVRANGDLFHDHTRPRVHANLAPGAWQRLSHEWHLAGDLDGAAARKLVRQLFRACLALVHAPEYEADHADGLAQDWAHVPLPRARPAFEELVRLGELIALLLDPLQDAQRALRARLGADGRTLGALSRRGGGTVAEGDLRLEYAYYGAAKGAWRERAPASGEELRPSWGDTTGDLYLNDEVFLRNVPRAVWAYELGGYPVLKKWLGYREAKRRDGRPLTLEEAGHLRGMVQRIAAVLTLHDELNAAYQRALEGCFTAEDLGLGGTRA
jgi:hypothetical protein